MRGRNLLNFNSLVNFRLVRLWLAHLRALRQLDCHLRNPATGRQTVSASFYLYSMGIYSDQTLRWKSTVYGERGCGA